MPRSISISASWGFGADGYHDLRTIFQSLALADLVTVRSRSGAFELTCDDPQVPTDRRNLVWKAASLLWRTARLGRGEPRDICITLQKRIPPKPAWAEAAPTPR